MRIIIIILTAALVFVSAGISLPAGAQNEALSPDEGESVSGQTKVPPADSPDKSVEADDSEKTDSQGDNGEDGKENDQEKPDISTEDTDTEKENLEAMLQEAILIRLPAEEPDPEEEKDEKLSTLIESAQGRISELEERMAVLEEEMQEMRSFFDEIKDALPELNHLRESMEERENERRLSADARKSRNDALRMMEKRIADIETNLARGISPGEQEFPGLIQKLNELAGDAGRHGHMVERERIESAAQFLLASQSALARRDLHETRIGLGLALGQISAARSLVRMHLEP